MDPLNPVWRPTGFVPLSREKKEAHHEMRLDEKLVAEFSIEDEEGKE